MWRGPAVSEVGSRRSFLRSSNLSRGEWSLESGYCGVGSAVDAVVRLPVKRPGKTDDDGGGRLGMIRYVFARAIGT